MCMHAVDIVSIAVARQFPCLSFHLLMYSIFPSSFGLTYHCLLLPLSHVESAWCCVSGSVSAGLSHLRGQEGQSSLYQQTHQPLGVEDELVTTRLFVSEHRK